MEAQHGVTIGFVTYCIQPVKTSTALYDNVSADNYRVTKHIVNSATWPIIWGDVATNGGLFTMIIYETVHIYVLLDHCYLIEHLVNWVI